MPLEAPATSHFPQLVKTPPLPPGRHHVTAMIPPYCSIAPGRRSLVEHAEPPLAVGLERNYGATGLVARAVQEAGFPVVQLLQELEFIGVPM